MSAAIKGIQNRRAAIYCHPAESNQGLRQLKTSSRGIATFEFQIVGKAAEQQEENTVVSADPREGISALELASRFVLEVSDWHDDEIVWLVDSISSGNDRHHEVPVQCQLTLSCWFENYRISEIEDLLQSRFAHFNQTARIPQTNRPQLSGLRANPARSTDDQFNSLVEEIILRVTGEPVEPYSWHSASDIRFPQLHHGIPTVGFGCLAGGFYGGEEWIDKESFSHSTEALVRLLEEM